MSTLIKNKTEELISKSKSVIETITPQKAKIYLEKNNSDEYNNRSVYQPKVDQYARDMKNGDWRLNGETIIISKSGRTMDGQHRLLAVIQSGVTIQSYVIHGVDDEVFASIGTGKPRTSADAAHIAGFQHASKISAIVKFVLNFQKGQYSQASLAYSKGKKAITNEAVVEYIRRHEESLYESYNYGYNKENKVVSGTYLAGLHYIFKKLSETEANDFCNRVADGLALSKDNPIYLLRQRLISDVQAKRKMPPSEKLALICKSWNFYRKKRKISRLSLDIIKEGFPKPI